MRDLILAFLTSFGAAYLSIPLLIKFAHRQQLVDKPGRRKIHKETIPTLGGIAIFLAIAFGVLLWALPEDLTKFKFLFGAVLILAFLGIRDDLIPIKPIYKLIIQVAAASLVVFVQDIRLVSLYGIFGNVYMPLLASQLFSVFAIVLFTNAFNFIDGVDGLAGSLGAVIYSSFGVWFYLAGYPVFAVVAFCVVGALLAFLRYNWSPAKIFMGDTGSMLLGFLAAILAMKFIDYNEKLPIGDPIKIDAAFAAALSILIVPIFDLSRLVVLRLLSRKSPFSSDKSHVHHLLMRAGMKHASVSITLAFATIAFVILTWFLQDLGNMGLFLILLGASIVLMLFLDYRLARMFPKKTPKKKIFK
jgi:UDP-N-acetylmuramyl pentapeptide phosphotransferase/UDP-N-acetylglucosamine-1-phosphate transferase